MLASLEHVLNNAAQFVTALPAHVHVTDLQHVNVTLAADRLLDSLQADDGCRPQMAPVHLTSQIQPPELSCFLGAVGSDLQRQASSTYLAPEQTLERAISVAGQ